MHLVSHDAYNLLSDPEISLAELEDGEETAQILVKQHRPRLIVVRGLSPRLFLNAIGQQLIATNSKQGPDAQVDHKGCGWRHLREDLVPVVTGRWVEVVRLIQHHSVPENLLV